MENTKYVVFFCGDGDVAMSFDTEDEAECVAEYLWRGISRPKREYATCQVITAPADSLVYEDGTLVNWEETDSYSLEADRFDVVDGPEEHRWY